MVLEEIFYSVSFVSTFGVIWFYTDFVSYYLSLFNIMQTFNLEYLSYIAENPYKYFPDFLHEKSLHSSNRFVKFCLKLLSCPFCLLFWGSLLVCSITSTYLNTGVVYLISLLVMAQIKKML